ncbi:MAG TPA: flagellar biosynthesis anti-sigma factor FlgM [Calditerricola sp.]
MTAVKVNGPSSPYGPSAYTSLRSSGVRAGQRHAERDTVEISPEAKAMLAQTPVAAKKEGAGAADANAPAASRAARLAELKAAIASGTYRVPAEAVAERLLQRLFDEQA